MVSRNHRGLKVDSIMKSPRQVCNEASNNDVLISCSPTATSPSEKRDQIPAAPHPVPSSSIDPATEKVSERPKSPQHPEIPPTFNQHAVSEHDFGASRLKSLSADTVRDVVLPLLMRNIALREGNTKEDSSDVVRDVLQNVLTDEACQSITDQMLDVRKQLRTSSVRDSSLMLDNVLDASRTTSSQLLRRSDSPTLITDTSLFRVNGTARSSSDVFGNRDDAQNPSKRRRLDAGARYSPNWMSESSTPVSPQRDFSRSVLSPHSFSNLNTSLVKHRNHPESNSESLGNTESFLHRRNLQSEPHSNPSVARPSTAPLSSNPSEVFADLHDSNRSTSLPLPTLMTSAHSESAVHLEGPKASSMEVQMNGRHDMIVSSPQDKKINGHLPQHDISPDIELVVPSEKKPLPCHKVPSIWSVGIALSHPGILEFTFDIDEETAKKWNIRPHMDNLEPSSKCEKLAVHLLSLPLGPNGIQNNSHPQNLSQMWTSMHSWPSQGSLTIQINQGEPYGKTWFPYDLGPENVLLNITAALHVGVNKICCLQLSPLEHLFVVHTSVVVEPDLVDIEQQTTSEHSEQVDHG
ncbi:hypothetical protein GYMLUDRAFT_62737 [Collybiopsis luxurians FD-317 M1]|uniref:Unplaced genomic scaffold GYMLUscaffold_61, whole genome shotgun sequence n=1 Tax=Collybiopsis luxurians FD-317 M1 TaxID=944289 RepID=A0A0D0AX23_9AGAR|nr:hypothetical protein GYMLUDRAFT_62737 [Collybiopsis luxurians FD-317 M1]